MLLSGTEGPSHGGPYDPIVETFLPRGAAGDGPDHSEEAFVVPSGALPCGQPPGLYSSFWWQSTLLCSRVQYVSHMSMGSFLETWLPAWDIS